MNLPDEVVDRIFKENKDCCAGYVRELLEKASLTYNNIIICRREQNDIQKKFEDMNKICSKALEEYRNTCNHMWVQHRSGVDSADDFEECLVCGKQI